MCNILHFCGVKNGLVAKLVVMNYAAGGCIFLYSNNNLDCL